MLSRERILYLFNRLNEELREKGEIGEIGIVGGTVMCLVYNARKTTRDVDAIFEPADIIRQLAERIADEEKIPVNWLNDGAKGYLKPHFAREDVLNLSHLRIWAPDARYMMAMKCISARWDTSDKDDVIFLVKYLKLRTPEDAFKIIENYYPKSQIPSKTGSVLTLLLKDFKRRRRTHNDSRIIR